LNKSLLALSLILVGASTGLAQDVTFSKTKFSSPKQSKGTDVNFTVTDSKVLIKSRKASKKVEAVDTEIPYSTIDTITYEFATRHRVAEGAAVMALSLGAGAVIMGTKTKSHWLSIDYQQEGAKQTTVLQLDKSEYEKVIATLESKSGKNIVKVDAKKSDVNPTAESKDMDEVVPFTVDRVDAALRPAMDSMGCKVTGAKVGHIECKRARGGDELNGFGGEKVTAALEAKGDQTHVRIWTGKGFSGRLGKHNWSTPIYQEMMKNLQKSTGMMGQPPLGPIWNSISGLASS
jgi:hypothetical protein